MMARQWRFLEEKDCSPVSNLCREEAIARGKSSIPTVRIWSNSPCVVIGRFQVLNAEVNTDACIRAGVPVYRRFTGGGAVYHDLGNLNISLLLPKESRLTHALERVHLPWLYSLVLRPLGDALTNLGLMPTVGEREIRIGENKISGCAAWSGIDAAFVHATLLINSDLNLLERLLAGPGAPDDPRWERTKSRRCPVTSFEREGIKLRTEKVIQNIRASFAAFFACSFVVSSLTVSEEKLSRDLFASRYTSSDWHANG